ncbi:MAG: hypothetical protein JOS17DRAFT_791180 [Linnemannia elongata]|nr:MAG: hypothetical protein JOS17DRAFT_791180 [Linnemannia elongata]
MDPLTHLPTPILATILPSLLLLLTKAAIVTPLPDLVHQSRTGSHQCFEGQSLRSHTPISAQDHRNEFCHVEFAYNASTCVGPFQILFDVLLQVAASLMSAESWSSFAGGCG